MSVYFVCLDEKEWSNRCGIERWKRSGLKQLYRHVPILRWCQSYSKTDAVADVIVGITISLTMIPQSIAYAALAGLAPQYGLNSIFMGCFVYMVFGTIKEVSIGPTSLMALLTFEYTRNLTPDFVVLLTFLCGCVEFLMGLLRLGFLVDFISRPVTSGFTTATSIIIVVSQIKGLLGIRFKSCGFLDNIYELFNHLPQLRIADFTLGVSCVIILLLLRKLKDVSIGEHIPGQDKIRKLFWFISMGKNALIVIISTIIAYHYDTSSYKVPFILSRAVQSGLPPFRPPPLSATIGNTTYTFPEMVEELGSAIFTIPVVAVLANVAIAKAFTTGGSLDATQEMLTLSICNVLGSFVGSMPTCGAFTRSAVASASGIRTPMANLYSGILSLLALCFLTQYAHYIPRATLSAVLITAVVFLVDYKIILPLWRSNKVDLSALLVTLAACLCWSVEIGLLLGVVVNLSHLLYLWARPTIDIQICKSTSGEYYKITPDLGLVFPAVDTLYSAIVKYGVQQGKGTMPVVLNCNNFTSSDFTSVKVFGTLAKNFSDRGQQLLFLDVSHTFIEMWKHCVPETTLRYCSSTEDIDDLLFGENLATCRSVTVPVFAGNENDPKSEHEIIPLMENKDPKS